MSVLTPGDADRRRSPRYSCGGAAKILSLPSNGPSLPGRVRDLSLRGCCIETVPALDCGVRTEIVLRVSSGSFRAVSQVKGMRDRFGVGMEFVHLSTCGKEMLADVVERLARLQALVNQLRSGRRQEEAAVLLRELEREGFHAILLNQPSRVQEAVPSQERREEVPRSADSEPLIVEAQAEIVPLDLFV
jgi:PilZ domain-containing protein